eukprot:scaffold3598_cov57-Phaeocystis_antarctica.AAC.5
MMRRRDAADCRGRHVIYACTHRLHAAWGIGECTVGRKRVHGTVCLRHQTRPWSVVWSVWGSSAGEGANV